MPQTVDIAQFALAIEDLLRPFPGDPERLGEGAEQFNNLGDVVVVFTVLGTRLRVKEIITRDEFENLAQVSMPKQEVF